MYIYTYIYTHIYIHIYIYTYLCVCTMCVCALLFKYLDIPRYHNIRTHSLEDPQLQIRRWYRPPCRPQVAIWKMA